MAGRVSGQFTQKGYTSGKAGRKGVEKKGVTYSIFATMRMCRAFRERQVHSRDPSIFTHTFVPFALITEKNSCYQSLRIHNLYVK